MFAKKLSNKNFVDKAPKAVVEKDTARFEELKAMREKLEQSLKMLGVDIDSKAPSTGNDMDPHLKNLSKKPFPRTSATAM